MKTLKNIKPSYALNLGTGLFMAGGYCGKCGENSVIFNYDTGRYKCTNCGWTDGKSYYPSDGGDNKEEPIDDDDIIWPYRFRCYYCGMIAKGDETGDVFVKIKCPKSKSGHYWEML